MSLRGKRVLVTRPRAQASSLARLLADAGADPIVLPSIEVTFTRSAEEVDGTVRQTSPATVVFSSINGVAAVKDHLAGWPAEIRTVAVGPGTAAALEAAGRPAAIVGSVGTALGLAEELSFRPDDRVLWIRGESAPDAPIVRLRERGATVLDLRVYRTVSTPWEDPDPTAPDLAAFTSSSAVLATHERLVERNWLHWLAAPIIAIGPVTAHTVRLLGLGVAGVAHPHTLEGLVDKVREVAGG